MAEVTGMRNNALPYPVYGAPWAVTFPMLDADGDLVTGATTPDAEVSKNGDTFADCTNESTEIATNSGVYYLLLTAAEMTADIVTVIAKSATAGMKTTVLTFYPRKLVSLRAATAAGGAAGSITLDASASAIDDFYNGCLVVGVLDSTTEARIITDYTGSTKVAAVTPNWNTTPDSDDTFTIYLPEGRQINQANVTHVAETAQTARDIGASVLLSNGTGTGQLKLASGYVAMTWADIAAPTTTVNFSGTTVKTATDVETDTADIQSRLPAALTAGGNMKADVLALSGDTTAADNAEAFFDGTGYAGTNNVIPTVTSVTGAVGSVTGAVGSVTAGVTLAASAVQAIWDALTSALTTVGSIGKLLVDNVNATISSRATPAQVNTEADTALSDVGLTTTVTGRIDAAVSTRATPAQVNTEADTALADVGLTTTITGRIDAAVSTRATPAQVNTEADTALADVGLTTTVTGRIDAAVSTRATPAEVNTEVLDVLTVDTFAEASAVPAATSSLKDKLNWLFALARNKLTQTSSTQTLRNDADSGSIATAAVADDGTTASRAEWT